MPKCPFDVPTRKIKEKDRCNYIKSDGKRCRCYHKKQSMFCANHQTGSELVFNNKGETEVVICHHKHKKDGYYYKYTRYLKSEWNLSKEVKEYILTKEYKIR